jgi:hypothetical protein
MRIIYCLLLVLPLCAFAQSDDENSALLLQNFDWLVENSQGSVLAISGDSLNFDEKWMHVVRGVTTITAESESETTLEELRAPCWVEVSYFARGKRLYVRSLRFLRQLEYDEQGSIIGDHTE